MQNNPYAFPRNTTYDSQSGMTMRDWFAGQALAGMMASEANGEFYAIKPAAERAYQLADAMMAERERGATDAE